MVHRIPLSGKGWYLNPDGANVGETSDAWHAPAWFHSHKKELHAVSVPNSWQSMHGLSRYEGVCWYFTEIERGTLEKQIGTENHVFLRFNGANYIAKAWLNGVVLGEHEGGFLPFTFEITKNAIKNVLDVHPGPVVLSVRVDNTRLRDGVPELSTDWFQWGGVYRDVVLEVHPALHVKRCLVTPVLGLHRPSPRGVPGVEIDCVASPGFEGTIVVEGPGSSRVGSKAIVVSHSPGKYGSTKAWIPVDQPVLWSPVDPKLYMVRVLDRDGTVVHVSRFGMREIAASCNAILLNGTRIVLKGCSLHEEKLPVGREYPRAERERDLLSMKALGFNFLRTAHYSHDESLMELADEIGMLVGEEIPVYWNIDYRNPRTLRLAMSMMRDLIHRDYNHPSVIWWSAGNEVPVSRRDCQLFFQRLLGLARKLDPSRLVVYVSKAYLYDPLRKHSDLLLLNTYLGWYYFNVRMLGFTMDMVHSRARRKPMLLSEFGAGARLGVGRTSALDMKFSEWKQASILGNAIKACNARQHVSGWAFWIYRDFRSHMRLNEYQQGYNRKGIVDERDKKKLAALWMPKLSRMHGKPPSTFHTIIAAFYSKLLLLPAAFLGIVIDVVLPAFMHKRDTGYYLKEPWNEGPLPVRAGL